jgi:hypothetical protein
MQLQLHMIPLLETLVLLISQVHIVLINLFQIQEKLSLLLLTNMQLHNEATSSEDEEYSCYYISSDLTSTICNTGENATSPCPSYSLQVCVPVVFSESYHAIFILCFLLFLSNFEGFILLKSDAEINILI